MLLVMPATTAGLICTFFLLILGGVCILTTKMQFKRDAYTFLTVVSVVFPTISLGISFYDQWIFSSKVQMIASGLRVSTSAFVCITAIFLCVIAFPTVLRLFHRIQNLLTFWGRRNAFTRDLLISFAAAAVAISLSQRMIGTAALSMGYIRFFWGMLVAVLLILFPYCLCGKIGLSSIAGTTPIILISAINAYVYRFRGRLFEPVDLFSAGTAMNVVGNYSLLPIPGEIITSLLIWIGLMLCIAGAGRETKHTRALRNRFILLLCCIIGTASVSVYSSHMEIYHWDKEGAIFNGYVLDFVSKIRAASISEPEGYTPNHIDKLVNRYAPAPDLAESGKTPHIIVIMDEAFSDLSVTADINTDTEVTPYISSLNKDVISGYALASVYGGNTANSEFEFLTGNSMAWLPSNSVPYQQYMRSPSYSMVSYLKSTYNYTCIAMHPYLPDGWNRPSVYENLGFDSMRFIDDFPQEKYVRKYISDLEMFETIVSAYESRHSDPLFIFGVTMQNHGGYIYSGENYKKTVSLTGYDDGYPEIEQYLSLIHETDQAVEYLISYFENVNDDVIIVFFGDHQPKLDVSALTGTAPHDSDSLDTQQLKYKVPFFIWANYDIAEKQINCTSLNYLSSYVYDAAGLSLPMYNRFLSEMEKAIPSINAYGFYSAEKQRYLPFHLASEEELEWLQCYEYLQYNNLFDPEHRNNFFPVPE